MSYRQYSQIKAKYPEHVVILSHAGTHTTYEQDAALVIGVCCGEYDIVDGVMVMDIPEAVIDRNIADLTARGHQVALAWL